MSASASALEASTDCDPNSGAPSVADICAESGWAFVERGGECIVKLEVNRDGAPFSARVGRAAGGGVSAWAHLAAAAAEIDEGSNPNETTGLAHDFPVCREAAETVFSQLANRVSLVRGIFRKSPAATTAGLEVLLPADCGGEQLADALSALSVACELAGPEIRLLLSDPDASEPYLGRFRRDRGRSPRRHDSPGACVPGEASSS